MRTFLCMAIGLAAIAGGVPASFAQDSRTVNQGKPAVTASGTHQGLASNSGISIDAPIGSVMVGSEVLDGEPVYVRRTTGGGGVAVVEVSTTPFMPVLASNEAGLPVVRPDQPAGW